MGWRFQIVKWKHSGKFSPLEKSPSSPVTTQVDVFRTKGFWCWKHDVSVVRLLWNRAHSRSDVVVKLLYEETKETVSSSMPFYRKLSYFLDKKVNEWVTENKKAEILSKFKPVCQLPKMIAVDSGEK